MDDEDEHGILIGWSNYVMIIDSFHISITKQYCLFECEDINVLLKRIDIETKSRTVISSGKRPNPSDLGS